jgi:hypothetical protein
MARTIRMRANPAELGKALRLLQARITPETTLAALLSVLLERSEEHARDALAALLANLSEDGCLRAECGRCQLEPREPAGLAGILTR